MSKDKKPNSDAFNDLMDALVLLAVKIISELAWMLFKLAVSGLNRVFGEEKLKILNKIVEKRKKQSKSKVKIEIEDLEDETKVNKFDVFGWSVKRKKVLKLDDIHTARHTIVCGASGSGKTVLMAKLFQKALKSGHSILCIDPKNSDSNLEQLTAICKIYNKKLLVVSPSYTGPNAIKLNPLKDGSYNQIADRFHTSLTWSEEHYKKRSFAATLVAARLIKQKSEIVTFHKLLKRISSLVGEKFIMEGIQETFVESDISGIKTDLLSIITSEIGSLFCSEDGYSFAELRDMNACVYIGLPVLSYPKQAPILAKVFLGDMFYDVDRSTTESHRNSGLNRLSVFIDELGSILMDGIIEYVNKCRESGHEATLLFQSPSDIAKVNPHLLHQLHDSCKTYFIGGLESDESARFYGKTFGTFSTFKDTVRVDDGEADKLGSRREVEEFIVNPNIFKNLKVGQFILKEQFPKRQFDIVNVSQITREQLDANIDFKNVMEGIADEDIIKQQNDPTQEIGW